MIPLSEGARQRIAAAQAQAETPAGALLTALAAMQAERRRVGPEEVADLAARLGLSTAHVQGVARFYDRITADPEGELSLGVCMGLPCVLNGGEEVAQALARALAIPLGATTSDGRFSLGQVACLGACDRAPAVLVGEEAVGPVSAEAVGELLRPREEGQRP